MNRNITLILSAVMVVVLLGIWIYLVFFADRTPNVEPTEGSGAFAEFGELGEDAPAPGADTGTGSGGSGDATSGDGEAGELDQLRQLTTKQVVGYAEIDLASTTHIVFMESGTGHIYSINLTTGVENRVSATTIPDARAAAFSAAGTEVLVKTGRDTSYNPLQLGTIDYDNESISLVEFASAAGEFTFTDQGNILYTSVTNSSVVTRLHDMETAVATAVFETPFREAVVQLNQNEDGPHIFYPKTSSILEGFVYGVSNGNLTRLPLGGYSLAAHLAGDTVVTSYRNRNNMTTVLYNIESEAVTTSNQALVPEKCTAVDTAVFCASQKGKTVGYETINQWLRGTEQFTDSLWQLGETDTELINILNFSGRQVDVINSQIGPGSNDWYFQNKNDNSLWIYELSRDLEPTSQPE